MDNNLPDGLSLHPDFGDVESMFNMRKWLQSAIEKAGAKQTGAGMGMGQADIDFTLDGYDFNVRIKALTKVKSPILSDSLSAGGHRDE